MPTICQPEPAGNTGEGDEGSQERREMKAPARGLPVCTCRRGPHPARRPPSEAADPPARAQASPESPAFGDPAGIDRMRHRAVRTSRHVSSSAIIPRRWTDRTRWSNRDPRSPAHTATPVSNNARREEAAFDQPLSGRRFPWGIRGPTSGRGRRPPDTCRWRRRGARCA